MRKEPKIYSEFQTKKQLLRWIEDNIDKIDFDEDVVEIDYYLKENEEVE